VACPQSANGPGGKPWEAFRKTKKSKSFQKSGALQEAARIIGLQIYVLKASTSREIDALFATLARERPDALFVAPDAFWGDHREQLINLAARARIPAAYHNGDYVVAGGLMSYATNLADTYRQIGIYSGRILRAASPSGVKFKMTFTADGKAKRVPAGKGGAR
jgi:ABC-type uncharacterized transport system substrate-binding protein